MPVTFINTNLQIKDSKEFPGCTEFHQFQKLCEKFIFRDVCQSKMFLHQSDGSTLVLCANKQHVYFMSESGCW